MATHSSVIAWRIPGMGKPSGLPSMGSHRVGHDWSDLAAAAAAVVFYYTYTYRIFFIHSSVSGYLGCLHIMAIINSAAINIGVHVSFWIKVFIFSVYIPRIGIGGSYGNSTFNFVRKLHTVHHSGFTLAFTHNFVFSVVFDKYTIILLL